MGCCCKYCYAWDFRKGVGIWAARAKTNIRQRMENKVMDQKRKTYEEAVRELSLMLMYLTRVGDNNEFCRYRELSWKGYNFEL